MRSYTIIKVLALVAVAAAVIFLAYRFSGRHLGRMEGIVAEASAPDTFLIRLDALNAGIAGAESGVRAFAISHDERYLVSYHHASADLDPSFDTLRLMADGYPLRRQIDKLQQLAREKFGIYEELMLISYAEIFDSALVEIERQLPEGDTASAQMASAAENKRSFLQKIFSTGPSKRELQARIDSALEASRLSSARIHGVRKGISQATRQQSQRMRDRLQKELDVLRRDQEVTDRMHSVMADIKSMHGAAFEERAATASAEAARSASELRHMIAVGVGVMLLFIGLIIRDIIRGARQRRELDRARSQAERYASLKEEFLARMSHEIRTPLTSILGYTGRMSRTPLSQKQSYYTRNIQISSEHLLSIVNDILDISRIDSGKLVFEETAFSPADVIGEVCDVLQIKASEKELELRKLTHRLAGMEIKGDPLRLRQVLFNLAGNAIKFTDTGTVTVEGSCADTTVRKDGRRLLTFRVKDTGPGIPKAKLKTLFSQYAQADESISRRFGGSGLGLSISKKIIEQMGGEIMVESEVGHGSVFTCTMPFEVLGTRKETPASGVSAEGILEGLQVLLAEDVEINRALQEETLTGMGAQVKACADGDEVLDALQAFRPDVILMDIQMPRRGGVETIREIREGRGLDIPAIAMTANAREQDIDAFRRAGFDDVLIKPFREHDLAARIRSMVRTRIPRAVKPSRPAYELEDLVKASRGNNGFVARMLRIFLSSGEGIIGKAEASLETRDWEELAGLVHRLIPSCRQLSAFGMAEKLGLIEELCHDNQDEHRIRTLMDEVKAAFTGLRTSLEQEISNYENADTA